MRWILSTLIIVFCIEALVFPVGVFGGEPIVTRTTIYVDDDAIPPGQGTLTAPYRYIQDAITYAEDGDDIKVASGLYDEHIVIDKKLTLNWHGSDINGSDTDIPVINGGGIGVVVKINSSDVVITRFAITNGGNTDLDAGIYIAEGSINVKILETQISFCNYGIWIKRSSPVDSIHEIRGNSISDMARQGIMMSLSDGNSLFNNIIANCSLQGLYLFDCYKNRIKNNIFRNNSDGLVIDVGVDNDVEQNICENNTGWGFIVINTQKTVIKDNNFMNNNAGQATWINCFADKWFHNYWGRPRFVIGIIGGILRGADMSLPWVKFELNPSPTFIPIS
jgi:parallel beta-helix repeat protein